MSIKIKKINPNKIFWSIKRKYRYENLFAVLRGLKMWETIEITLDNPNLVLSNTLGQCFRKERVKYRLQCKKLDKEGFVWAVRKISRTTVRWKGRAKFWHPVEKKNKKSISGWMNEGSLSVLRFSKPNEISKNQRDGLKVLYYPRVYNKVPYKLQKRKKPLSYKRVKVIVEELCT